MSRYVIKVVDYLGHTRFKTNTGNFNKYFINAQRYANEISAQKWLDNHKEHLSLFVKDGDVFTVVTEEEAQTKQDKDFKAVVCSEGKVYFNNEEITDPHLVDLLKEVATYIK